MIQHPAKLTYFNNLDAFRFLSFLGVFLSHTLIFPEPSNIIIDFFQSLVTLNYLAVPFFFTLSSFLITYRLLSEEEKKGSINLFNFYKNRILRIWPAYYLLILICFFLLPIASSLFNIPAPSLPPILPFIFFYANFYIIENGLGFTFALTILWSISIEEQFYFIWGWILKLITKKRLALLILLLFAGSVSFSYYYLYVLHKPAYNLVIHSFYVLQNFCTGALMALICVQKEKVYSFLSKLSPVLLASIYIVLPIAYFFMKDVVLLNIIKSTCYSLIIYDQCFNERRFFNAGRFAFINYLGKISYGLYLYHALVFVVLQKKFNFFSYDNPTIPANLFQVLITFIVTCIVSHISYKYIESKFLALKSA